MNCDTFGHPERLAAALGLLWHSLPALVASFAVTVAVVPVARAVAHRTGVVDQPDKVRKLHGRTVAYLGGVGLFVGVFAGIITNGLMAGGDLAALPPLAVADNASRGPRGVICFEEPGQDTECSVFVWYANNRWENLSTARSRPTSPPAWTSRAPRRSGGASVR